MWRGPPPTLPRGAAAGRENLLTARPRPPAALPPPPSPLAPRRPGASGEARAPVGPLGVPEIEAVRERVGPRPHRRQIPAHLVHARRAAAERIDGGALRGRGT